MSGKHNTQFNKFLQTMLEGAELSICSVIQ